MAIITEDDWNLWKNRPITKQFFKVLNVERERVKELLVLGLYEEDEQARGIAKCLSQLLEMDYEEFRYAAYGELKRDTPEGA